MSESSTATFECSRATLLEQPPTELTGHFPAGLDSRPSASVFRMAPGSAQRVDLWLIDGAIVAHGYLDDANAAVRGSVHAGPRGVLLGVLGLISPPSSPRGHVTAREFRGIDDFIRSVVAADRAPTSGWVVRLRVPGLPAAVVGSPSAGFACLTEHTDDFELRPSLAPSATAALLRLSDQRRAHAR